MGLASNLFLEWGWGGLPGRGLVLPLCVMFWYGGIGVVFDGVTWGSESMVSSSAILFWSPRYVAALMDLTSHTPLLAPPGFFKVLDTILERIQLTIFGH